MDYRKLGSRVREMRKKRGYTQEQLAERANISFAFIGHIERGTRKLSVATLLSLARALNCPTDFLLDNLDAPSQDYLCALRRVADFVQGEIDKLPRS